MTNGNKIVPAKQKMQTVRELLKQYQPQMAEALPLHRRKDAERMARIVLTEIARTPRLLECTPASLIGAVLQAAAFGLDPGLMGDCWLIPYRNNKKGGIYECQFQLGYKGLLKLCRRSGEIGAVQARVVREKDHFAYAFGLTPKLEHVPSEDEEAGDVKYIYTVIHLKDGTAMFDVWTTGQIEAHRKKYSRAAEEGPWVTAWEEMAKKTVLLRVCKLAPASVELQTAIALDELAETGQPQDLAALVEPAAPLEEAVVTKADQLAQELKDKRKGDAPGAAPGPNATAESAPQPPPPPEPATEAKEAEPAKGVIAPPPPIVDPRGAKATDKVAQAPSPSFDSNALIGQIKGLEDKLALKPEEKQYLRERHLGKSAALEQAPVPALAKLYDQLWKLEEKKRTRR